MGIFDKIKEPIFLKENSDAQEQLKRLEQLEPQLNAEGQAIIRQDIKYLEYGIIGERTIAFELKNSHMPMYILHDIYLEDGDLGAQIDYLVVTKKMCFVIECKNLYGNIEINNVGDFIRTMEFGNRKKKEGIYSPITQNQRHLELMKKIKVDNRNNILTKFMTDKYFDDFNKSVVVLANPKTVLNAKFAKKEIKEKVIRADQLVNYIKDMYNKSKESVCSEERLLAWARGYVDLHKNVEKDYTAKYEQYKVMAPTRQVNETGEAKTVAQKKTEVKIKVKVKTEASVETVENKDVFKALKEYRLEKSRKEKIKPYFIFNDNQLRDLVAKMPETKDELMQISGFAEGKVGKYGDAILSIIENGK